VVSLLWLGWASREDVHWVVPLMAVVPFGLAYQVIFAAMLNVSLLRLSRVYPHTFA
jgi:hypothetical protein